MKKVISLLITLCLACMMCIPVFAESAIPAADDVKKEINDTAAYLIGDKTSFTVDDATMLYYIAQQVPDALTNKMMDTFLEDVKQNLAANGNTAIIPAAGENMTTYAAVVSLVDIYSENGAEDFNGTDLSKLLTAADPATIDNPYNYTIVIPVMSWYDEDLTKQLCDKYIADYYTEGKGVDYYGFACDNTCMFVKAICNSGMASEYMDILDDAISVIDTYKVEGGYCYNPDYGTSPNADSTGLALMAKSCYAEYNDKVDEEYGAITDEEIQELSSIYYDLLAFKGPTEGSYLYDDAESAYAASDALKGLNDFWWPAFDYEMGHMDYDDEEEPTDDTGTADENDDTDNINEDVVPVANDKPAAKTTGEKSYFPNTGDLSSVITLAVSAIGVCGLFASRKKED